MTSSVSCASTSSRTIAALEIIANTVVVVVHEVAESTLSSAVSRSPVISKTPASSQTITALEIVAYPVVIRVHEVSAPGISPLTKTRARSVFKVVTNPIVVVIHEQGTPSNLSSCPGLHFISSFCLLIVLTESYRGHHCQCNG